MACLTHHWSRVPLEGSFGPPGLGVIENDHEEYIVTGKGGGLTRRIGRVGETTPASNGLGGDIGQENQAVR
jgi:hypothetical protein